jgi:hypothetical protein
VETLNTKTENLIPVQFPEVKEADETNNGDAAAPDSKRAFVEPEVSFPIDVLESTTFFQFTESGVTLP